MIGQYHEGISNKDYHANKEFYSSSQLKKAVDSHATFKWYMENGSSERAEWSPSKTDARDFGSLVHTLLLEPHLVMDEFIFIDTYGVNFRTKEGKALKAKHISQAEASGKILLRAADLDKAKLCVEAVKKHPFAMDLLNSEGKPELSGYFEHDGLKQRFRPDRLVTKLHPFLERVIPEILKPYIGKTVMVDVKTTAVMEDFDKKAKWEFDYDLSGHMYLLGHKILTGEDVPLFFLVVESQAPYRVAVRKASDKFLATGKLKYDKGVWNVKRALNKATETDVYQTVDFEEI